MAKFLDKKHILISKLVTLILVPVVLLIGGLATTGEANAPEPNTYTPQEYLALRAYQEDIADSIPLLERIIVCESGWKPEAQNSISSAGGLFQFLDSTWARYANEGWEKYNPQNNIDAGIKLFKAKGTSPWLASKGCW